MTVLRLFCCYCPFCSFNCPPTAAAKAAAVRCCHHHSCQCHAPECFYQFELLRDVLLGLQAKDSDEPTAARDSYSCRCCCCCSWCCSCGAAAVLLGWHTRWLSSCCGGGAASVKCDRTTPVNGRPSMPREWAWCCMPRLLSIAWPPKDLVVTQKTETLLPFTTGTPMTTEISPLRP